MLISEFSRSGIEKHLKRTLNQKWNTSKQIQMNTDFSAFYLRSLELLTGKTFTKITVSLSPIPPLCQSMDLYNGGHLKEIVDICHLPCLTSLFIPNGVTAIRNIYDCGKLESLYLPASLQQIGRIYNCTSLKTIRFGNLIESCGQIKCENLTRLEIGGMMSIGDLHYGQMWYLHLPTTITRIGSIYGPKLTAVILPDSLQHIGNIYCVGETFKIPTSLTYIGCMMCPNLTNLIIPDNVQFFGGLFKCSKIKNLVLPNSIQTCPNFDNCTSLTSIVFGSRITRLHRESIINCTNLTYICGAHRRLSEPRGVNQPRCYDKLRKPVPLINPFKNDLYRNYLERDGVDLDALIRDINAKIGDNDTLYELFDMAYKLTYQAYMLGADDEIILEFLQLLEKGRMFYDD